MSQELWNLLGNYTEQGEPTTTGTSFTVRLKDLAEKYEYLEIHFKHSEDDSFPVDFARIFNETPPYLTQEQIKENHLSTHKDNPCDYDKHDFTHCHFCGTDTCEKGYEYDGTRHWLSDCRPDLVKHEPGDACTWSYEIGNPGFKQNLTCYAYQSNNKIGSEWTDSHSNFYPDGPC